MSIVYRNRKICPKETVKPSKYGVAGMSHMFTLLRHHSNENYVFTSRTQVVE